MVHITHRYTTIITSQVNFACFSDGDEELFVADVRNHLPTFEDHHTLNAYVHARIPT